MNNFIAVIITEDHYNALGMLRSLGECGIENILLLTSQGKTYVDRSKYVRRTVKIGRTSEDILSSVKEIAKENKDNTYILFPLSDFAALVIDENYDTFPENVIGPNMAGQMAEYQNKAFSKERAKECGLNTAKGTILDIGCNSRDWNIYPAILKPLASVDGFKSDICIVTDYDELIGQIASFKEKGYCKILIEEYICGNDEHMIEVMGYAAGGKVEISGIISKIREYPIKNGSTAYAKIVDEHEDINIDNIKKYIKQSGFCGLFDIEFKYSDGTAYFIECNFRNGAPAYAFTCKGQNIAVGWLEDMLGISVERKNKETDKQYFMAEQNDFINMLKGNVTFGRWIKEFNNSNKLFFSRNDLKPITAYYFRFFIQIFKRLFNGKVFK